MGALTKKKRSSGSSSEFSLFMSRLTSFKSKKIVTSVLFVEVGHYLNN